MKKYSVLSVLFLLLLLVPLSVQATSNNEKGIVSAASNIAAASTTSPTFPQPTDVTPTLFCLGGVPCTSPDPTATTTPPVGGTSPTANPSVTLPLTSPTTTVTPCESNDASIQHYKHKKHKKNQDGGFLSKFFEFIMKLLEMFFKMLGMPLPENPNPAPEDPDTLPTPAPEDPQEPTPCPEATTEPEPTGDVSPTVEPSIGAITPTIFGTTPVLSPTGTTVDPTATIFVGDYETGDVSQWPDCQTEAGIECSAFNGTQHNIKAVSSPVRQGKFAGRFELRDGEGGAWSGNERTETLEHIDKEAVEGAERWYQWSTQFTPGFAQGAQGWAVVTQWHDETDESPPLSFDSFSDGSWGLIRNGVEDEKLWGTTQSPSTWHDIKIHIVWSANASKGLLELWHNGQKQTFTGGGCSGTTCKIATLRSNSGNVYLKQGLYRKDTNTVTTVIFHDGFSMAKTESGLIPLQ